MFKAFQKKKLSNLKLLLAKYSSCPGRTRDAQSGIALVEFAILAPLFLTLGLMSYDLGTALNHHHIATEVAREGVRQAIGARGLERGRYTLTESLGSTVCQSSPPGSNATTTCPANAVQRTVLNKIFAILKSAEKQQRMTIVPNSRKIIIEYGYDLLFPPSEIRVKVEFNYRGFSPLYYDSEIGVSLTSSYL